MTSRRQAESAASTPPTAVMDVAEPPHTGGLYERYFGLNERPFDLSPNPRFLFLSAAHHEALTHLRYGLTGRPGLTMVVGEAGTGKTSLVKAALEGRADRRAIVHLSNPTLRQSEFLDSLTTGFGLSDGARVSKSRFLAELQQAISAAATVDRVLALIVDEAQSLPRRLLEEIRLLTNLEGAGGRSLAVALVGQPELAARLEDRNMRQLKQRITLRCELTPLNLQETAAYIARRVQVAGGNAGALFSKEAVAAIYEHSSGLPRMINVICDNALVSAFALDRPRVDCDIVIDVCRDYALIKKEAAPAMKQESSPRRQRNRTAHTARALLSQNPESVQPPHTVQALDLPDPVPPEDVFRLRSSAADLPSPSRKGERGRSGTAVWILAAAVAAFGLWALDWPRGGAMTAPTSQPAPTSESAPLMSRPLPFFAEQGLVRSTGGRKISEPRRTATRDVPTPAVLRASATNAPVAKLSPALPSLAPSTLNAGAPPAEVRNTTPPPTFVPATPEGNAPPIGERAQTPTPDVTSSTPAAAPAPAATAAPVVSAPPATAPATEPSRSTSAAASSSPRDDQQLVRQTLQQYQAAYDNLDARMAHTVWPAVNEAALARAFDGLASQKLTFAECDVQVRGPIAAATCRGSAKYVGKVGNRAREETRTWRFTLRKVGADWKIEMARTY